MSKLSRTGYMRYMKKDLIVGIDPDVDNSGVAILDTRTDDISLMSLSFTDLINLFDKFKIIQEKENVTIQIYIEYSAATKHNWHLAAGAEKKAVASAKGYHLGRNHQLEQCIYEYAKDYMDLDIIRQAPFKKCWKGKDRKITHDEIVSFMPIKNAKTNQEERDAALLAWLCANKPIVISNK